LTEQLIERLGYVGIALILVLGGLGLPIPEEAPIILAAVLTRNNQMSGPMAVVSCLLGVLLGDFLVYFLGFFYGEKVLRFPLTRRLLTRQREAQIKGYFHRHGFKILVSGRFVPGFRTAAYLTAGILKLPALKLLLTDLVAATLSTSLMFGLGLLFAHQIQKGIREVQQWLTVLAALGVAGWLLYRYYRAQRRAGLPIGPPVMEADDVPLPALEREAGPPPSDDGSRTLPPVSVEAVYGPTAPEPGPVATGIEPPASPPIAPRRSRQASSTSRPDESIGLGVNPPAAQPPLESPSRS
jgi:membrane protein DedA with SNARE-associated domain